MSLGRWLLVACFFSIKNHNVSGPHLFPSFTTRQKNPFATPRAVLQRAKKSLCNRSQFRTLSLPHRFIKIRPSHQRPVSIEFPTICRIPEFSKSEQNRKSCGNVRIWRKRVAVRRKNHSNLNKSFGMNVTDESLSRCNTLLQHTVATHCVGRAMWLMMRVSNAHVTGVWQDTSWACVTRQRLRVCDDTRCKGLHSIKLFLIGSNHFLCCACVTKD